MLFESTSNSSSGTLSDDVRNYKFLGAAMCFSNYFGNPVFMSMAIVKQSGATKLLINVAGDECSITVSGSTFSTSNCTTFRIVGYK